MAHPAQNAVKIVQSKEDMPIKHIQDSQWVSVYVGEHPIPFRIREYMLAPSSEYFQAVLRGPWLESRTRSVKLEDDSLKAFEVFARWIGSHGTIFIDANDMAMEDGLEGYVLGDKLVATRFKNDFINRLISLLHKSDVSGSPYFKAINQVWDRLPESSKLRQLLVDIYAGSGQIDLIDDEMPCADFQFAVLQEVLKTRTRRRPVREICLETDRCERPQGNTCKLYHEH